MIQGFLSTKRALLTSLLALTFLGVGALVTFAAPTPNSIAYQGFLTSATGTAQTGTTTVTVRLYDASTGGTLLFEELHPTTPIVNGYFSVQIGSVGDVNGSTAATGITDLLFDKSYYLTVELGSPFSTGEMTTTGGTRSQLGTVPFATISYGTLQVASSTHLTTGKGKLFFNTSSNELNLYNGTSWVPVVVQGTSTSLSALTVTGQSTLATASATALTVSGKSTLANASATSLTATSLYGTNATISSTTTTEGLVASILNAVTSIINSLTGGTITATSSLMSQGTLTVQGQSSLSNASTSNLSTTNLYATGTASLATASATSLTVSGQTYLNNASTTNVSVSNNLISNNLTSVSATSTNFFATLLNAVTAIVTNLTATNATATNLVTTNSTSTNSFISSLVATLADITDLVVVGNSTTTGRFAVTGTSTLATTTVTSLTTSGHLEARGSVTTYATTSLLAQVTIGTTTGNPTLDSLVYIESTSTKKSLVIGSQSGDSSFFSVDWLGKVKAKVAAIGTGLYADATITDGLSGPTDTFTAGRYTYVASYAGGEVQIFDTFNKDSPILVSSVDTPGAPTSVYVSGDYAYTTNDYTSDVSIVDVSDSLSPVVISSVTTGDAPNDIQVVGSYAYVANYSGQVFILDVSSTTDLQVATSTSTGGGDFSLSVAIDGNNLYVASLNGVISIFDITTPTDLVLLATTTTLSAGGSFAVSGNISVAGGYAYILSYENNTISVLDVSNPSAPSLIRTVATGNNPFSLSVSGGYLYVSNYSDGSIAVYSLSNPSLPTKIATLTAGDGAHSTQVVDGYLYVANYLANTVSTFNVSDIAGPSTTANNLESSNLTVRNNLYLSGLTAGSVPFIGAGGRVSQDTNFFWDNTSKSLGVGTAAPTATLSVRGQVGVSAFLVEDINAVPLFSVTETGTTIVGAPSSVPNSTFVVSTVSGKDALSVLNSSGGTILSLTEAGVLRPNILELGSNGNGSSSIVINGAGLIEAGTTVIGKDYFSILSTPSTGARPADLVVVGDYVYTADRDGGGVSSINVSNKRQATTTSFVATGNYPIAIASSDDFLYVVNANDDTLSILDISSSSAPFVASTTGVGDYPIDVAARGDYVYVVSTDDRYLTVIDVSSPSSPTTMSSTLLGQDPYSISINGNYAYIGTNVGTVLVVDITDPTNPIEIVPIFPTGQGVSYVYAEDTYLYISNTNTDLMYIYDISDPNFPIAMSNIKTDAVANSGQVMVQGDFAYVIDISSGSVLVIDIRNKSLPVARARAFTAPYSERFFVKDNYLFAANQNGDQLTIVDLGGLSSVYASISTADFGKLFAKGFSSFLGGLSVGSTTSRLATLFLQSEAGKNPFVIASSSGQTILSVTQQGSLLLAATTPTSDNSKLVVQGTTTLIGSTGAPTALRVIGNIDNTATSTFTPRVVSSVGVQGGGAYDVDVEGSYAYVVNNVGNNLSIIDVSNKNSPVVISTTTVGLGGVGVIVRGKYAYVTAYDNSSFNVVDVSNARAPTVVSSLSVAGTPFGIDVSGSYAYVTRYNASGISVIDISVPDRPRVVGTVGVGTNPQAVAISGRYAYVANRGDDTVSVLDITNPASPVVVATHAVGDTPSQLTISDQYLYVANFNDGDLRVVDVANPLVPVTVATLNIGGGNIIASLDISGRYAYITNNANSFIVADISDPTSPHIVSTNSSTVGGNSYSTVVSGRYAYVTSHSDESLTVIDLGGIESTSALIHSLEAGNLSVRNDISTGGLLSVGTGLTVGSGGFLSQGNSAIYGSLTVGTSTYPNFLVNTGNNTTNIGTSTGLASLFVQGTSTLNPFTVASSSGSSLFTILANGNVGVGTAIPGTLFEMSSSIFATGTNSGSKLRISGNGSTGYSAAEIQLYDKSADNNWNIGMRDHTDDGSFRIARGTFGDNTSDYLTILSGGNVGIGATSPSARLQVTNDLHVRSSTSTDGYVSLVAGDATSQGYVGWFKPGATRVGYMGYTDGVGTNNLGLTLENSANFIINGGNVGIGTTSIQGSSKLFVEGSINIPQNYALRANNNWLIGQSSSTNTINIGSTAVAGDIQFDSSSGTGLFIVKSDGNIGIGSTTPFAKLSIGGFSGTGIALTPTDNATILSSFNDSATGDPEQLRISHNFSRVNIDNLRSDLNLQSYGGDVVIGTTSPSGSRLDIYHNTASTNIDIFRLITDVGGTNNVKFRIDSDGDLFTDGGTTINSGADLAENYTIGESGILPGMLVRLTKDETENWDQEINNSTSTSYAISKIKKAGPGDEVFGVISTNPGIVLGGNTTNSLPVAFSGRVPVYVSNENGIVRRGDSLTISSSTPGYAMKQTTNGQSIGRAISDQDGNSTSSLVMMIVEQKERTITVSAIEGLSLLSSSSTPPATTVRETLLARLSQGFSVVREYIAVKISAVTGYFDTVFAGEVYADTLDAQVLCLGEGQSKTCVTKEKLDSLLLLDPNNTGSNGGQTEGGSSGDTNGLTGDLGGGETVNGSTTDDGSENGTTTDIGGPSSDSNTENETPDQNQTPEGGAADVPPEEILP